VSLSYENEAINAQQKGQDVDYVIPDQTILIQNPAAVTKDAKPQASKFLEWLHSDEAQKIYAKHGYRPVVESLVDAKQFPAPKTLFKIDDLGGWSKVNDEFFDPASGSVAAIEQDLGVSTAK
jgi:sulfate transport system substrate-binding protein